MGVGRVERVWEAAWAGLGGRLDVGVEQEGGSKRLAWDPEWLKGPLSEVGEEADGEAVSSALGPACGAELPLMGVSRPSEPVHAHLALPPACLDSGRKVGGTWRAAATS